MSRERSDSVRSIFMSNLLENEKYGIEARNENKCTQLIGQLGDHVLKDSKSITCGGMAETTTLREDRDGDSDIMGTVKRFLVIEGNHMTLSYRDDITYISIIRNKRYPGYCKLQLSQACYDVLLKSSRATRDQEGVIASVDKQQEKLLISSKLFNENVGPPLLIPTESVSEPMFKQNGPARRNRYVDYVRSFEFSTWPQEAQKWKQRQRKHNWPCTEVLDILENEVSCNVVPTGNKSSKEFDLEWRLSFVEIERELIWNMNDTQFKCYVCLKRLKKVHLNKECDVFETISTYQIKNIMFWMCEIIPEYEWKSKYLLRYVLLGLRKLQSCIWLSYNAHYIIPENNLWQNVVFSMKERRKAIRFLENLTERSDNIENIISANAVNNIYLRPPLASPKVKEYGKRCDILLHWGEECLDEAKLEEFYQQLTEKFPETDIFLPCKGISKAKLRWFLGKNYLKVRYIVNLMKSECDIDYLTCSLNIAMVYFVSRKFSEVVQELKSKLSNLKCKVYMTDGHASYKLWLGTDGVYHFDAESIDISDLRTHRHNLVLDFRIGQLETDFLPFPLKLQRCLFGNGGMPVFANPLVLGCYLLVLSAHYLGQTSEMESARKLLVSAVSNTYSRLHNYHYFHLYLLGHSYYVTGDRKEAYSCFAQSVVSKPSRLNAAIYHIAIMINESIPFRKIEV